MFTDMHDSSFISPILQSYLNHYLQSSFICYLPSTRCDWCRLSVTHLLSPVSASTSIIVDRCTFILPVSITTVCSFTRCVLSRPLGSSCTSILIVTTKPVLCLCRSFSALLLTSGIDEIILVLERSFDVYPQVLDIITHDLQLGHVLVVLFILQLPVIPVHEYRLSKDLSQTMNAFVILVLTIGIIDLLDCIQADQVILGSVLGFSEKKFAKRSMWDFQLVCSLQDIK